MPESPLLRPAHHAAPHYGLPGDTAPLTGPIELAADREPVVWVPDAYGQMVPMLKSQLPAPTPTHAPRDLTPQPLIHPRAQILAAAGIAAAGIGWGVGQAFTAFAGIGTGSVMWAALGVAAWKIAPAMTRTTNNTTVTTIHNTNRWFGTSHTHNR